MDGKMYVLKLIGVNLSVKKSWTWAKKVGHGQKKLDILEILIRSKENGGRKRNN
jgi:hypothetical protein